jgi:hypothetical protein
MVRYVANAFLLIFAAALVFLDIRSGGRMRLIRVSDPDAVTTVYRSDAPRFESSFGSFKWRFTSGAFTHAPERDERSWVGSRRFKFDLLVLAYGHELVEVTARGRGSLKSTHSCRSVPCVVVRYRPTWLVFVLVGVFVNRAALSRLGGSARWHTRGSAKSWGPPAA